MALLHYWNLGVHRPDILMRRSFDGLRMFYEFLKRTREYLESDVAVKRLAWDLGEAPPNGGNGAKSSMMPERGFGSSSRRTGGTSPSPRFANFSTRT